MPTDEYVRDLNREYVARVGREAAARLVEGVPVAIPYEPGNMTRYEIVLTPLSVVAESPSARPVSADCARHTCVVLALVGEIKGAITLPVLDKHGFWMHPSYLEEKLNINGGDARALLALLEAISDCVKLQAA